MILRLRCLLRFFACNTKQNIKCVLNRGLLFDMYPQSVVFFVGDSGCAVRPTHTPQIKRKLPQTSDMYPQYWVSSIGGTYHFCLLLSLYSEQHFRCFQFV